MPKLPTYYINLHIICSTMKPTLSQVLTMKTDRMGITRIILYAKVIAEKVIANF